ncbi:hypothetical protein BRC82_01270 [Halobacteriales archaeon QS_1_67_19]|nr:MAG: hypothetical protein BRC82_01270 [Halobacteriales archaeon QS_1_67_19]
MDETRRRRLAIIWVVFAFVMTYVTLVDGIGPELADLLGLVAVLLALGLAYVYRANPNGVLDLGD